MKLGSVWPTRIAIVLTLIVCGMLMAPLGYGADERVRELTPEQQKWLDENPHSLPIWMTPEEEARKHEIGLGFRGTPPPPAAVRMPGEFEPVTGVLIRWPLGIPYDLIAEMSEDVEVWTIVGSSSQQTSAESAYTSNGVNMANCHFFIAGTDSYWTRDYGPWYVFTGNDEQGVVDHIYNRPRPNDDEIPEEFGNYHGIPVYGMDLEATGGNWMCDGLGVGMSTRLTYDENPGMTEGEVDRMLEDYCGITEYHGMPYAESGGIHHIDCWAKLLSPDTILVEEQTPTNASLEANVTYFESLTSSWGTPYTIVRIPVGNGNTEAYTNSLILNTKVLVPTFGTSNDATALAIYQAAMPGYEVVGFDGSWLSDDAIHCRAKGIVDEHMLYIDHTPLQDTEDTGSAYDVDAFIYPYGGQPLSTGFPVLRYSLDGGVFSETAMSSIGGNTYRGTIPAQPAGTAVRYYIYAEDDSGRSESHPYIGVAWAHDFDVIVDLDDPQITHTPMGDQSLSLWPATVTATVTDTSGITEVLLEYRINSIEQTPVTMINTGGSSYEADFGASVSEGDLVEYRIKATDDASTPNTTYHPVSGYHAFDIVASITAYVWNASGGTSASGITTTMDAIGCSYDSGTSLTADPGLYDSIFVCLGVYSSNHALSSTEGSTLAGYLDTGGCLYMEGGDTWAYDTATSVHAYFQIDGTSDGSGDCGPVNGTAGTFTEGMSFTYSGANSYMDHLSPLSGAVTVFQNGSPAYDNGIAYDGGSYKTIGCGFDFGGLVDAASPSTKADLLSAYLDFFGLNQQPVDTVEASLVCAPGAGTVPFNTSMTATLTNLYTGLTRRLAGRLNVDLAGGQHFGNWKSGWSNVDPGGNLVSAWNQSIPALGNVIGTNLFQLEVEDVTPSPYNQAPHPPAGDTDTDVCTVTGIAP